MTSLIHREPPETAEGLLCCLRPRSPTRSLYSAGRWGDGTETLTLKRLHESLSALFVDYYFLKQFTIFKVETFRRFLPSLPPS